MSYAHIQQRWFDQLKDELSKYFNKEETAEIINYYDEMIHDKLEDGQDFDDIIKSYDPKQIAKQMIPRVIAERQTSSLKLDNNAKLIILVLFSTPVLIPLGALYVSLMAVASSMVVTGIALVISAVGGMIITGLRLLFAGLATPDLLLALGINIIGFALMAIIGYWLLKVSWVVLQRLSIWISKMIVRKRGTHENF
ncbi:DUF1700 domain-containing protein [Mycoplasmatota bacterium]|nr:DUF1700 domain-containing protein [Mycoplasmatota bacterium]